MAVIFSSSYICPLCHSPQCQQYRESTSVLENQPAGTFVLQVHAVDADEGSNGRVTYGFMHKDSTVPAFSIHPDTGTETHTFTHVLLFLWGFLSSVNSFPSYLLCSIQCINAYMVPVNQPLKLLQILFNTRLNEMYSTFTANKKDHNSKSRGYSTCIINTVSKDWFNHIWLAFTNHTLLRLFYFFILNVFEAHFSLTPCIFRFEN